MFSSHDEQLHPSKRLHEWLHVPRDTITEQLLGLKFTPYLKWNTYMPSIDKNTGNMTGSFYYAKENLISFALFYLL